MRAAKAVASMRTCAGSPLPWLLANAISTKMSCAGSIIEGLKVDTLLGVGTECLIADPVLAWQCLQ